MAFLSLILLLCGSAFASDPLCSLPSSSLDATLLRDLARIESYREQPSEWIASRLKSVGIAPSDNPILLVFLYFPEPPSDNECLGLADLGVEIIPNSWLPPLGKEHPLGFLLAEVKATDLIDLLSQGVVIRAAAAYRPIYPKNDLAAQATGAASARENVGLTGSGVRVAVIDSGFDLDNPDMPQPIIAMNYADFPDSSEWVFDPGVGHGTHVAGIIFASGEASDGRWMGMAPGADPILIRVGNDDLGFTEQAVVYAIRAAGGWMNADIMSLSLGTSGDIPDGSSPIEQAVDWAFSQGTTVFCAAGNEAGMMGQFNGILAAEARSEPIETLIMSFEQETFLEFGLSWWNGEENRDLSVEAFDEVGEPIRLTVHGPVSSPRGTETIYAVSEDPLLGMMFFQTTLVVTNDSDEEQDFHLFPVYSEQRMSFLVFPEGDDNYTVSAPASADNAIAVGAYTTRDAYTSYNGAGIFTEATVGALADFSSRGPRIDERLKPELCAPGQILISLRDRDIIQPGGENDSAIVANNGQRGQPGEYLAMSGTSMASPCAAGCAALVLEAFPDYTARELRGALLANCNEDRFVWETPNNDWGWGKIDALRTLSIPGQPEAALPAFSGLTGAYPNPFNSQTTVSYSLAVPGEVDLAVFDLMGRQIQTIATGIQSAGSFEAVWDAKDAPSGLYLIKLKAGSVSSSRKVMLVR